jgi:hypothetical protein
MLLSSKAFTTDSILVRDNDSKLAGVVLVQMPEFATNNRIAAFVEIHAKAVMLDKVLQKWRNMGQYRRRWCGFQTVGRASDENCFTTSRTGAIGVRSAPGLQSKRRFGLDWRIACYISIPAIPVS